MTLPRLPLNTPPALTWTPRTATKSVPMTSVVAMLTLVASTAFAQTEEGAEGAEAPAAKPAAASPDAAPPAPVEEPQPVEEEPAGPVAQETMATDEPEEPAPPMDEGAPPVESEAETPAEEEFSPKFTIGAGLRTGLAYGLSGPTEKQLSLNDGLVDQVHIRPFMAGSLTPNIGYFVQFEIGTPGGLGNFAILDGMGQIKFVDELQLWVGQHIPANDRNNMNGPFFGNTWNFGIAVEEYPFDVGARDRGATLWGLIADGMLKYHLSVVDLQPGGELKNARVAGRLTLHLLEPENFYYNSGTYFGGQDILAFGAVVQSQKGVDEDLAGNPVDDNDLLGFSLDAMFEKNLGDAGTFTVEGGYWNYEETGPNYVVNQGTIDEGRGVAGPYPGTAYMGILSWLTPNKIGIGQIQPNFRFQYAEWEPETRTVVDVGLAYVVDGFNHKYHLNYRHQSSEPAGGGEEVTADIIQVGLQYQMSN